MRWREFYTGATFCTSSLYKHSEDRKASRTKNFIPRTSIELVFLRCVAERRPIILILGDKPRVLPYGGGSAMKIFAAALIKVIRLNANYGDKGVLIEIEVLEDSIPHGVKPGNYVLEFDGSSLCYKLPHEMFIDEEVEDEAAAKNQGAEPSARTIVREIIGR